jgi:hypothetical protein
VSGVNQATAALHRCQVNDVNPKSNKAASDDEAVDHAHLGQCRLARDLGGQPERKIAGRLGPGYPKAWPQFRADPAIRRCGSAA